LVRRTRFFRNISGTYNPDVYDLATPGTFHGDIELAHLYPPDIRQLSKRSGFDAIEITGDFEGRPFEKNTDELVIEGTRA
jgi:hypothetical protein